MPASFRTWRTVAGFIGAWRMRTPVASKNAFATAELIAVVGGSPEPDSSHPLLNAAVLPACTSCEVSPGRVTVYLPGCTLTSVTVGLSLKRRIGYETQSRLVTRSLSQVACSYRARERPWISAPLICVVTPSRLTVMPLFCATVACLTTILPVLTLTSMSATTPTLLDAKVPKPKPRPLRTSPVCCTEFATFGFQPAAMVEPSRTESQREPSVVVGSMFCRRNAIGSIFAAYASSSTICSLAKYDCGAFGARSALIFSEPPYPGWVFASTRRCGTVYTAESDGFGPPDAGTAGHVAVPSSSRWVSIVGFGP